MGLFEKGIGENANHANRANRAKRAKHSATGKKQGGWIFICERDYPGHSIKKNI
jgi:hypothetical protein